MLSRIPQDCSVEKLFPGWEALFKAREPLGHVRCSAGPLGDMKIPYWGLSLDPCEDNTIRSDGTIDHQFYIFLCKWSKEDPSPITVRYPKRDIIEEENLWEVPQPFLDSLI